MATCRCPYNRVSAEIDTLYNDINCFDDDFEKQIGKRRNLTLLKCHPDKCPDKVYEEITQRINNRHDNQVQNCKNKRAARPRPRPSVRVEKPVSTDEFFKRASEAFDRAFTAQAKERQEAARKAREYVSNFEKNVREKLDRENREALRKNLEMMLKKQKQEMKQQFKKSFDKELKSLRKSIEAPTRAVRKLQKSGTSLPLKLQYIHVSRPSSKSVYQQRSKAARRASVGVARSKARMNGAKLERCVKAVKAQTGYKAGIKGKYNPWAVCKASLKKSSKKSVKKSSKKSVKKSSKKTVKKSSKKTVKK